MSNFRDYTCILTSHSETYLMIENTFSEMVTHHTNFKTTVSSQTSFRHLIKEYHPWKRI